MYFVRHGESVSNAKGVYTGRLDVPLSDRGRDQARDVAREIKNQGVTIEIIFTSPLIRAGETARIIAAELNLDTNAVHTDVRLVERDFGNLVGKTKIPTHLLTNELLTEVGGEMNWEVRDRVESFIVEQERGDTDRVLVIAHNGSGKQLTGYYNGLDADQSFYDAETIPNATLVKLHR